MKILSTFCLLSALVLVGCSQEKSAGPINAMVINYSGSACKFSVSEKPIYTLDSITDMRGAVGRVVRNDLDISSRPDILDDYFGFKPVDLQFSKSGTSYGALDSNTLFATSLYYSIEQGYLTFQKFGVDFGQAVPNLYETRIVHNAIAGRKNGVSLYEINDNAEFLAHQYTVNGQVGVRNFFFSYPTNEVKDVPLGLNIGVMVHEFSHLVFNSLYFQNAYTNFDFLNTNKPTDNTFVALDEGMADYFGFMATGDPMFFQCSFPEENRNLTIPKAFTQDVVSRMALTDGSFDSHEGGAIWASIQYEIGTRIGYDVNARSLVQLMSNLSQCPDVINGTNVSADFGDIARCHFNLLNTRGNIGSQANDVRAIYQKYLGTYGGRF